MVQHTVKSTVSFPPPVLVPGIELSNRGSWQAPLPTVHLPCLRLQVLDLHCAVVGNTAVYSGRKC